MSKLPISLTVAVLSFLAAGPAQAGGSRVAVAPFSGPEVIASEVHAVVVEVVAARHQLVPAAELEQARVLIESDGSEPRAALTAARLTGADAVVIGRIGVAGQAYALSLSVLRARTGESVGAVMVPLAATAVTPAARDRIELLLANMLSWVDPAAAPPGASAVRPQPPEAEARPGPGHAARPSVEKVKPSTLRFPIAFEAAVGLSATARRLGFSQEAGLAADASLAANPSPGLHVEAAAATIGEPGVALVVSLDRSIGAEVALGGSAGVDVPVTQSQWGFGLRGRMRFRERWVPMLTLGYSELSYEIGLRPSSLLVPDARYAFLDAGAGIRYELGPAAVFGSGRYLLPMATSGITDAAAFGGASTHGLAGEAGAEVELTDAILLRAGIRYLRFVLDFEGSGQLAFALDADGDQDVAGAVDAFVGGYAEAAYRF